MKILFVCHRFPYPPKRGGKIRPFNIIRHLTGQGHEVTVASLARDRQEAVEGEGLADYCQDYAVEVIGDAVAWSRMLLRLPVKTPSSMGYFYSPALRRRIDELLATRDFDLIFVHCSSVAQYVSHVTTLPKILDFGDMDSQKWLAYRGFKPFPLSLGYWLEGSKMEAAERRLATHFDMCTCTTQAELDTLDSFAVAKQTAWFPNGVDRDYFAPVDEPHDPDTICFVGRMDYYPNQQAMFEFCRKIWPRIRAAREATQLVIIGADPSTKVRALAELPGVQVTGSVPDVRPYVRNAVLSVAPLKIARGTQNKILESLAMGVPVVCSDHAAGGVDALPNEHLLVAGNDDDYVRHILHLLEDPGRRDALSHAGVERVRTHHDWQVSMRRVDAIVEQTVTSR